MDGAWGGGPRTVVDPEGLLRSALEKIVFFECRVSQLESELSAARETAGRARGDAAKAERRALELEQALAGEKGARAEADRRATELHDRVRRLEAERERLLGGLVERARVSGAAASSGEPGPDEGGADLADFIAELRAEIETLRAFRAQTLAAAATSGTGGLAPAAPLAGPAADPASVADSQPAVDRGSASAAAAPALERARAAQPATISDVATRFVTSGRVGFTAHDAGQLRDVLSTRADRALYERSMDDLTSPDEGRRVRAVRALEALGSRAAAPLLAAALGREESAEVKAALLGALGRFREPFAADLAARQLSDPRPAVRVAALEALASVAADSAAEKLAGALSDASPAVRRRAALLLGLQAGDRAEDALAVALADPDRGVARAAAAALSGRPSAHAQGALARGLEHPDASVRHAAGAALSRVCGEPVEADGPLSARRAASRRIAERLAGMAGEDLRAAVLRSASPARPAAGPVRAAADVASARPATPAPAARAPAPPAPVVRAAALARPTPVPARAAVAVAVATAAPPPAAGDLAPLVVGEIRAALRGCTAENLAAVLGEPAARVEAALGALASSGTIAQRGSRWFMS
jgi:HEAT repeat protein